MWRPAFFALGATLFLRPSARRRSSNDILDSSSAGDDDRASRSLRSRPDGRLVIVGQDPGDAQHRDLVAIAALAARILEVSSPLLREMS